MNAIRTRSGWVLGVAGAFFAALSTVAAAQDAGAPEKRDTSQAEEVGSTRFARVGDKTAALRNVPDTNGRVLLDVQEGALVRVHGEHSGWVKVEVRGGFTAWVHSEYVTATDVADVVEITRNGVNVRALPSSGVNNFPVGQLYAGDRVRTLPTPLEFTEEARGWTHIWSPPGFWAWIRAKSLVDLAPGEDGLALWNRARDPLVVARDASTGANTGAPASEPALRAQATREALGRAHAAFDREKASAKPDFGLVRIAYGAVLELSPEPTVARLVEARLEAVAALEATASLRADIEAARDAERTRLREEGDRIRMDIADEARRKDPYRHRFDERGLLERRTFGDQTRYFLRWAGRDVCEIVCTRGRYDLDLFLGFDVGVRGEILPLPPGAGGDRMEIMDLARIEILAQG